MLPVGTYLREFCRRAGFDPELDSRYRTLDFGALRAIVATGRGVALVPEMALLPEVPSVVLRPLVDGPARHVRIATLAGVALSPAGLAMVDLLQGAAGSRPGYLPRINGVAGGERGTAALGRETRPFGAGLGREPPRI